MKKPCINKKHYSMDIPYKIGKWYDGKIDHAVYWTQLSYSQKRYDKICGYCTTCSFTSLIWRKGSIRPYILKPYLCYSGDNPRRYRQVSYRVTFGLACIVIDTVILSIKYQAIRWMQSRPDVICFEFKNIIFKIKDKFRKKSKFEIELGL